MDKLLRRRARFDLFSTSLLIALICGLLDVSWAHAQSVGPTRVASVRVVGYTDTVVTATAATTTPVDVLKVTFTPVNDPNGYSFPGYLGGASGNLGTNGDTGGSGYGVPVEKIRVWWSADVSKATATTGYCELYVNGALYAPSKRTSGLFANTYTLSGVTDITNTVTGAQTVKVQCASADTNTLTINQASMLVQEAW